MESIKIKERCNDADSVETLGSWGRIPFHILAHLSCMAKQAHNRIEEQLDRIGDSKDWDGPGSDELRTGVEGNVQGASETDET